MSRIAIYTEDGKLIDQGISNILSRVANSLRSKSGKVIAYSLANDIKNHFSIRFPGSQHYSPNKVTQDVSYGNSGTVSIDVPGVTRAYHDIDIYPRNTASLTIPLHRSAFGMKATSFNDLFPVRTNGKAFLAKQLQNGGLQFMYLLSRHVHQTKDSTIMPSDESLSNGIFERLKKFLDKSYK